MANTAATFGFAQFGYLGGGSPDYQLSTRAIQSTNASTIGIGDPVQQVNATSPYITRAVAGSTVDLPVVGIFQGCQLRVAGQAPSWSPFWPGAAAVDAVAYITDAPNALFRVAVSSAAITTGNIGHCVNFTGGAPNTTGGGFSIATIDSATIATATTGTAVSSLPFRVHSLYPGVGNGSDPTTNFNWIIVGFNNQLWRTLSP